MISKLLSKLLAALKLEPVAISGFLLAGLTLVDQQLNEGVTLESALTAGLIAIVTAVVRQAVYPAVKVDEATGAVAEPLEDPITGTPD
jgi:hypothetical protein